MTHDDHSTMGASGPPPWGGPPVGPPSTATPGPSPAASPAPPPPPLSAAPPRAWVLPVTAAVTALLAAGAVVALLVARSDNPSPDQSADVTVVEPTVRPRPSTTTTPASTTEGPEPSVVLPTLPTTTTTTTTIAPPPPTTNPSGPTAVLGVSTISASATRESANLHCTGELMSYAATNLLDGNPDTGWGASKGDGTGQSVDVSFGSARHLRSISISPGYLRVGPRRDQQCADVSAYRYNRIVTGVRYDFDDGSSVVHQFRDDPTMQTIDVDVVTARVRVTILGTVQPPNADPDTIISDLVFEGDS